MYSLQLCMLSITLTSCCDTCISPLCDYKYDFLFQGCKHFQFVSFEFDKMSRSEISFFDDFLTLCEIRFICYRLGASTDNDSTKVHFKKIKSKLSHFV